MAICKYTLYKYVKVEGTWRYCKAAYHDSLQKLEAEAIISRPATTWKMKQGKVLVPNT